MVPKFSVNLYLGPTNFDSAVLSWNELSALSTQMILLQAVFQHALSNFDL